INVVVVADVERGVREGEIDAAGFELGHPLNAIAPMQDVLHDHPVGKVERVYLFWESLLNSQASICRFLGTTTSSQTLCTPRANWYGFAGVLPRIDGNRPKNRKACSCPGKAGKDTQAPLVGRRPKGLGSCVMPFPSSCRIPPAAVVSPLARLGENVEIGPLA